MSTRNTTTKGRGARTAARPARKGRKKTAATPRRVAASANGASRGALINRADVARFVEEHAALIAAPDVQTLASESARLRARAAALDPRFDVFRAQLDEAIGCIGDYAAGRCDQIPYYTISLLAAALFYFSDTMDAIPDFLPRIGSIDDALVMAVATDRAADGLRRYRAWKDAGEPAREPQPGSKPRRRRGSRGTRGPT